MGDFKVVAENSEANIKKREIEKRIEARLRELYANMLRIIRGAGDPMDLFRQMQTALEQAIAHQELTGFLPSGQFIRAAISLADPYLEMREDVREGKITKQDLERWEDDGTIAVMLAEHQVVAGALQIVASELVAQKTQQRLGENELHEGIRAVEKAKEMHRKALRPKQPSPLKSSRKPKARKPGS